MCGGLLSKIILKSKLISHKENLVRTLGLNTYINEFLLRVYRI
jgi:hypothetical protein